MRMTDLKANFAKLQSTILYNSPSVMVVSFCVGMLNNHFLGTNNLHN